jgi:hypothetical protein
VSSYVVLVSDSSGRAWSSGSLAPGTTSVPYNFNGTARLPVLADGSYAWSVFAFDCTGPSASETRNSTRVQGLPFTVSGAPGMYSIGGTVTGLTGNGLALTTAGEPPLTVAPATTRFVFPYVRATGTPYQVSILQQPAGEACVVSNAAGTVPTGNVTNIAVTCATVPVLIWDSANWDNSIWN